MGVGLHVHAAAVAAADSRARRIVVNVKDDALRVSMSFFNNEEDLERVMHFARENVR